MNPLRRIDHHIRELKAIRKANYERVLKQIGADKAHLCRGDVDPGEVLKLLEKRATEHGYSGIRLFCEVMSLPNRSIERAKASGWMTYDMADLICCRLGVPTCCLYPYEQQSLPGVAA